MHSVRALHVGGVWLDKSVVATMMVTMHLLGDGCQDLSYLLPR